MFEQRQGEVIADRYVLVRRLATGGMGSVWIARHRNLEIDVAVKLMLPGFVDSPDQRARFEREAKAAARIKSPHVVQIHDSGVHGDTPYIVMELLDGESLGARLRRKSLLSPSEAAALLSQIGRGLRKAHELSIVHRDLKPSNIFLARSDDGEIVKIVDFGVAHSTALTRPGDTTMTCEILGSPPYMSPEQARGIKGIDHRADLWSLGALLYRMLTGRLPFQGANITDLVMRICSETPPAPSSVLPQLSPAIDAFFVRALARDPAGRYASAEELVRAFEEAIRPPESAPSEGLEDLAATTQWQKELPPRARALDETLPMTPDATSAEVSTLTGRGGAAMTPESGARQRTSTQWVVIAVAAVLIGGAAGALAFGPARAGSRPADTADISLPLPLPQSAEGSVLLTADPGAHLPALAPSASAGIAAPMPSGSARASPRAVPKQPARSTLPPGTSDRD